MPKFLKAKLQNELFVICLVTILLIPIVAFSPLIGLRIIFGIPFVLFFPGYTLVAALFPKKRDLGRFERIALSIVLSVAVVPLIGFILNYIWAIELLSMFLFITLFIFTTSAIAWHQRSRLPEGERFAIAFHLTPPPWKGWGSLDKVLSIALVVAILGGIGASAYTFTKSGQSYTEFYILAAEGMENYPQQLSVGEQGEVILVIVNHERKEASYKVEVLMNEVEQDDKEINVVLADGKSWEQKVSFSFDSAGENQKVEFVLYKDGKLCFENSPHLWVDVISP